MKSTITFTLLLEVKGKEKETFTNVRQWFMVNNRFMLILSDGTTFGFKKSQVIYFSMW